MNVRLRIYGNKAVWEWAKAQFPFLSMNKVVFALLRKWRRGEINLTMEDLSNE